MQGIVIEASDGVEWGPFLVCRTQDTDFRHAEVPLFQRAGWSSETIWVLDMRSGFGVVVRSDDGPTDLHLTVQVSALFRPFLSWLLAEDLSDLEALPSTIELAPEVQSLQISGLVVDAIIHDAGYAIVRVADDQGEPVTDFDLDQIEAALDEATSIRQRMPMMRATGEAGGSAKQRSVG